MSLPSLCRNLYHDQLFHNSPLLHTSLSWAIKTGLHHVQATDGYCLMYVIHIAEGVYIQHTPPVGFFTVAIEHTITVSCVTISDVQYISYIVIINIIFYIVIMICPFHV